MVSQPLFARLHNRYALTGSTGGEVSLGRDSHEKKLIEKIIEKLIEMEF